jgi:protein involved in polysaccharide export with SLBB domain
MPPFNHRSWLLGVALSVCSFGLAAQTGPVDEPSGPIRLRQPATATVAVQPPKGPKSERDDTAETREPDDRSARPRTSLRPQAQSEFERFVHSASGELDPIPRLGADWVRNSATMPRDGELSPLVPADYVLSAGDEVLLSFWGSVDADLKLVVDRTGRLIVPRVGAIAVGGLRFAELQAAIERRAGQVFRNFQVSATLGQVRGARVLVTGSVSEPGSYQVSGLTTALGALLKAGGPAANGSYRDIEVRRGGQLLAKLDLYELILRGDRGADRVLQSGDVVHVAPVGAQVGVIGSVNRQSIVELRAGETVADAIQMAGGFASLADRTRAALEPLQARTSVRTVELILPRDAGKPLEAGDVLRVFSLGASALPIRNQAKRVRVEGEVLKPGEFILQPGSTLADALRMAGGLTEQAFVFGAEFNRESVRRIQIENYDRALRDLETELARSNSTQRTTTAEQAQASAASDAAGRRLIERLRTVRPSGRVVLEVEPESRDFPPLELEDGDRLLIPAKPATAGVFGSVFNSGSFLLKPKSTVGELLKLAGGPTRGADVGSLFVIRMNGSVVSERQNASWFGSDRVSRLGALPGDTVFVPEELNKTSFLQEAKEWTQILYQFGLGAAALKTIRN